MSTAKSMATLYLNGKRNATTTNNNKSGTLNTSTQPRFKSSTSNLAQSSIRQPGSSCCQQQTANKSRLKSTSMTNLVAGSDQQTGEQQQQQQVGSRMQRPVSRNALDSIHNGMNAKYAQVQSKVYLQNIKPACGGSSKIPGSKSLAQQQQQPLDSGKASSKLKGPLTGAKTSVANERSLLIAKLKVLEDELASQEAERDNLRQELEREKSEKTEQVQQLKSELQEKLAEHDRQNEEYHKKLLEAYELADQNRRAADSVLSESRQRDEESRKKIEELESQLNELKEFVSMKEEMMGKMFELREQLRQERERYEEQLKSLHQVFENEKISHEERIQLANQANGMLLQHSSNIKLDENSNHYFNRMKPNLESNESINKPYKSIGCRQCQSGSSQLHKSEQDMYGSKMSTRMQDTAKSAWKASRRFASSVITGGVNLSACRQCTKRTKSVSPPAEKSTNQVLGIQFNSCAPRSPSPNCSAMGQTQQEDESSRHTSVIQVGPITTNQDDQQQQQQSPAQRLRSAEARQQQPSIGSSSDFEQQQQQQPTSLIRVDENNKLTIVTKFNDSECQPNGPEMGASSSVSERSRCESSSSGRGTSSDAGSAASQNGDDETPSGKRQIAALVPVVNSNVSEQQKGVKGHRRRSSLFKASKVFGGSQVSLHKLKNLFTGSSSKGLVVSGGGGGGTQIKDQNSVQQPQVSLDHIEASRLRCMELNQTTIAVSSTVSSETPASVEATEASPTTATTSHISATKEPAIGGIETLAQLPAQVEAL